MNATMFWGVYFTVAYMIALVLWWKRHPVARNPFFVVLMLPVVFMMFAHEWFENLRDQYNPKKN